MLALPVIVSLPAIPTPAAPASSTTSAQQHHLGGKKGFCNPWPSFACYELGTPSAAGVKATFHTYQDWKTHPVPPAHLLPQVVDPRLNNWGRDSAAKGSDPAVKAGGNWNEELKCTWLGHAVFMVEFPVPTGGQGGAGQAERGARGRSALPQPR